MTAAGVSAGIDMALWLAARIAGDDVAKAIQLGIEYDPQPPFDAGSAAKADPATVELLGGMVTGAGRRRSRHVPGARRRHAGSASRAGPAPVNRVPGGSTAHAASAPQVSSNTTSRRAGAGPGPWRPSGTPSVIGGGDDHLVGDASTSRSSASTKPCHIDSTPP